ncbi:MAG: lauroyl acyltransferase [Alphaproteobacteria bacterium]|nr:lauroyl acyltransferase [Alphaproteobacteria bacterium SS10]
MARDGRRPVTPVERWVTYPLQAIPVYLLFGFFWLLPTDWASALGSWLGRKIGPRLGVTKRARRNLTRMMPEIEEAEREAIILGMWDNLGRTVAEYPHLKRIWDQAERRIERVGFEHLNKITENATQCVMVSGHLANWEVAQVGARRYGIELGFIYRRLNNIYVNPLLLWLRRHASRIFFFKGAEGGRQALAHLKKGGNLALLIDQKLNEGIPVPFFGVPAMTAPAVASFTFKFETALLMIRTERLEGCRFRVTVMPPIEPEVTGDRQHDTLVLMTELNAQLEEWIKERPEQWLWLHNRWPAEAFTEPKASVLDGDTEKVTEEA